jgi:hypothetical protein
MKLRIKAAISLPECLKFFADLCFEIIKVAGRASYTLLFRHPQRKKILEEKGQANKVAKARVHIVKSRTVGISCG